MHGVGTVDPGRTIDWGRTSGDYAAWRPGPPPRFYELLRALGIGLPGQRILDLGTGTGVLARQFARQGCVVSGIDVAPNQLAMAKQLAADEGLQIDFREAGAEDLPFALDAFDVATANQCWLYFDPDKAVPEVKRVLTAGGLLVTSHFSWLPRLDPIAGASEELVLQHNPAWTAADYAGGVPQSPRWAEGRCDVRAHFVFDEAIAFTHESWRGRMRACRGVGAALSEQEVRRFDADLAALLSRIAPAEFHVRHRIDAHVLRVL